MRRMIAIVLMSISVVGISDISQKDVMDRITLEPGPVQPDASTRQSDRPNKPAYTSEKHPEHQAELSRAEQPAPKADSPIGQMAQSHYALVFFFETSCPHCRKFAPIVKEIQEQYGFEVVAFSFNGKPLPGFKHPLRVTREVYQLYYGQHKPYYPRLLLQNTRTMAYYPVANGEGTFQQIRKILNGYAQRLKQQGGTE